MFDLFKRYVDEGYMQFDNRGDIWFGKERLIIYVGLMSAMEFAFDSEISGWRYLATRFIASRREGYIMIQQHGAPDMKELVSPLNVGLKVMETFGMGTFRIVKADSEKGFAVITGSSTLGKDTKEEKASESPIDFMIGGLLAGVVGYYTKRQEYAVELSCVSQKDSNECVWVVGDRQAIMDYIQKASPDRVELGNKTLDEIEGVERELEGNDSLRGLVSQKVA
jgi:hypothetical protein